MKKILFTLLSLVTLTLSAQTDGRLYTISEAISAERIKSDIKTLTEFGTRHTLSDTVSKKRGVGAARRWIKAEFEKISKDCGDCLEGLLSKELS
jgi:hypothetical protein